MKIRRIYIDEARGKKDEGIHSKEGRDVIDLTGDSSGDEGGYAVDGIIS